MVARFCHGRAIRKKSLEHNQVEDAGRRFSTVGGYVVVALTGWRVINAEVAETQRTQRKTLKTLRSLRYTRSVWDLGLSVRHIFSMARRNDAE